MALRPIIEWPLDDFWVRSDDLRLVGQTIRSQGLFGPGNIVHVENRLWRFSLNLSAMPEDKWRVARAIMDETRGQYGRVRIPIWPATVPDVQARTWTGGRAWTGGRVWDAVSFDDIVTEATSQAGATEITIGTRAAAVQVGTVFSVNDTSVYRVARTEGDKLIVNPPLRKILLGATPLEFRAPKMVMRFTSDDNGVQVNPSCLSSPASVGMVEALE